MVCLLCPIELEGSVEPLCCICHQDNYVVLVAGVWNVFSNEGRLHASSTGELNDAGIVCLARERRRVMRFRR